MCEMNKQRASSAAAALQRFEEVSGASGEDAISDLITNLGHYCAGKGINFAELVTRAVETFEEEVRRGG